MKHVVLALSHDRVVLGLMPGVPELMLSIDLNLAEAEQLRLDLTAATREMMAMKPEASDER